MHASSRSAASRTCVASSRVTRAYCLALVGEGYVFHEERELAHRLLGDREVSLDQGVSRDERERGVLFHDFFEPIWRFRVIRRAFQTAVAAACERNRQPQCNDPPQHPAPILRGPGAHSSC